MHFLHVLIWKLEKFAPNGSVENRPLLVQVMAWSKQAHGIVVNEWRVNSNVINAM